MLITFRSFLNLNSFKLGFRKHSPFFILSFTRQITNYCDFSLLFTNIYERLLHFFFLNIGWCVSIPPPRKDEFPPWDVWLIGNNFTTLFKIFCDFELREQKKLAINNRYFTRTFFYLKHRLSTIASKII